MYGCKWLLTAHIKSISPRPKKLIGEVSITPVELPSVELKKFFFLN